jgi:selenocysteine-specific elongation factor
VSGAAAAPTAASQAPTSQAPVSPAPAAPATLPAPAAPADDIAARLPRTVTLHLGSARTVARVRPLSGAIARLSLRDPLPLHCGDRVLLRDPGVARITRRRGEHWTDSARPAPGAGLPAAGDVPSPAGPPAVTGNGAGPSAPHAREGLSWPGVIGAVVLDVAPPPLTRRGAAAAAARELATWSDQPGAAELLRRHGLLRASTLLAMGVRDHPEPVTGEWLADPARWSALAAELGEVLAAHAAREPLAPGLPLEAARTALGLPDRRLVTALARPPLRIAGGLVQLMPPAGGPALDGLPEAVAAAVRILLADLAVAPFSAPDAERLRKLGLDTRAIAAAARTGQLLRISDQIVLAPGADLRAAEVLATLPQPFTAADARQALSTTRRTAIPLLEYLDRAGVTERLPDDRRQVRAP